MKRKWIVIFVVMLMLCLVACHGPSTNGPVPPIERAKLSVEELQWLKDNAKASASRYEELLVQLPEGRVETARNRIENSVNRNGKNYEYFYFIELDDNGDLILSVEVIYDLLNVTEENAGHAHLFFKENLSTGETVKESYRVTMKNPEWLYEKLQDSYKEGEIVTVKIHIATDIGYLLMANGEPVEEDESSGIEDWWQFSFVMPAKDVVLDFKTYDGFLQHAEEAWVMREFWIDYPESDYVAIRNYYGKFESGAIVAMIDSGAYTQALWEENISHFNIRYNNGNRILVLYNGAFFTLTEAYDKGYLTNQDMADIENAHRQYYEYLYSDSE